MALINAENFGYDIVALGEYAEPVNGASFGSLTKNHDQSGILYSVYEISRYGLKVTTKEVLNPGEVIILNYRDSVDFEMIVASVVFVEKSDYYQVHLLSNDPSLTLDPSLHQHALRSLSVAGSAYRVRHARIPMSRNILVSIKTFGSQFVYRMRILNASKTGFLLEVLPGPKIPFAEGGLVECQIPDIAKEQTHCIAQIKRIKKKEGGRVVVACNINEIENEEREVYNRFIQTEEDASYLKKINELKK